MKDALAIAVLVQVNFLSKVLCEVPLEGFFPFGKEEGDEVLPRCDDCSTEEIPLRIPISYFGRESGSLWLNNNGGISFESPISRFTPRCVQQKEAFRTNRAFLGRCRHDRDRSGILSTNYRKRRPPKSCRRNSVRLSGIRRKPSMGVRRNLVSSRWIWIGKVGKQHVSGRVDIRLSVLLCNLLL